LVPQLMASIEAVLVALAAPQPADGDGTPDPRTPGQRRHDALLEGLGRILRSGTLPDCGGVPVTILATTTIRELTAAAATKVSPQPQPQPGLGLAGLAAQAGLDLTQLLSTDSGGLAVLGHGQRISVSA